MAKHLDYLDLPAIPEQLLLSPDAVIALPRIDRSNLGLNNPIFQPKKLESPELKSWLTANILSIFSDLIDPAFIYFRFQVIYPGFRIHVDRYNRRLAFNYLLGLGGDNVQTKVYAKDGKTVTDQMCLRLHAWHYLIAELPHTADNILSPRVALTVSFKPGQENEFFDRIGYTPLAEPLAGF